MILEEIGKDLKEAMLAGDKARVYALKNIKTTIQYAQVDAKAKTDGLDNNEIIKLIQKEAKKRQESADLYKKAGDEQRASAELLEKQIISKYLPQQLSEEEIDKLIGEAIEQEDEVSYKSMGKIISFVKEKAGASADGGVVAKLVKNRIK